MNTNKTGPIAIHEEYLGGSHSAQPSVTPALIESYCNISRKMKVENELEMDEQLNKPTSVTFGC